MPGIDGAGNGENFGIGEGRTEGEGQLRGMEAFAYGVALAAPFCIAFLTVWGERIVDHGLYAVLKKVLLKFVAM